MKHFPSEKIVLVKHNPALKMRFTFSGYDTKPGKALRKLVFILFYHLMNTHENQCIYNRIHESIFVFVVVVNGSVNKWHFHMF